MHVFKCIDGHTCGNPVRLIVEGGPELLGENMMERRLHFLNEFDWIRKGLMFEPRGHDMMSGSIIYPPENQENDFGVLFIETSGCLPMCGHGLIGTITFAIQEGLIEPKFEGFLNIETPAGLIEATYETEGDKVKWVKIVNVPSFLFKENLKVKSSVLGDLQIDIAYGGNFYAIIDPQDNFSGIQNFSATQLINLSKEIRDNINADYSIEHPLNKNINKLTHLLWTGETIDKKAHGRNAVFYGDKAIDRSPCGTGTSARMAQLAAKGKLKIGQDYIHESYIGSQFIGQIEKETTVTEFKAIIPSITGWAKTTGYNTIIIDKEDDPYAHGFQVI